jgi:signal transduction histidine kinase
MWFGKPWPRLRLATRLAIMTLLALIAVQALYAAVFLLIPARILSLYSAHWIIARSDEAASAIFQAAEKNRDALAAKLGAENHLHVRWESTWAVGEASSQFIGPFLERTRASIESKLKGTAKKVTVQGLIQLRDNFIHVDVQQQPPDFLDRLPLGPLQPEETDLPILGPFKLAIQGMDGSWVTIETEPAETYAARLKPWLITLIGTAAFVSFSSVFTAKKLLRPLERLVESARKFSRTRKAQLVDPAGLHEFEVIARAMNEMQMRIARFIDERTQMLAAFSHDLRTSLTGLRLDAEALSGGDIKSRLIAGMEEMEGMVSATLAFAGDDLKVEPAQMIDLAVLLISLCDIFADRGCDANYTGPEHLLARCKQVAIKRAFTNLIDNALKYGGCARVYLNKSGDRAIITIIDDGPGIPPDKVDLAFQPFGRLDHSRSRETGGVGLGLAIARNIIQAHGGEIGLGVPPSAKGLEVLISMPLLSFAGN